MEEEQRTGVKKDALITTGAGKAELLAICKSMGTPLGVMASSIGPGIFLCTVRDILSDEDENDMLIVFNDCIRKAPPDQYVVYLNEIAALVSITPEAGKNSR